MIVCDLLDVLEGCYLCLCCWFCDEMGSLWWYVNVFVDGENICTGVGLVMLLVDGC